MIDATLAAWMTIIAREGWRNARIDAVAFAAGRTTAEIATALPDRWSAVQALIGHLEVAALAEAGEGGSVRDRLFAMIMAGVDAAQAERLAVVALIDAVRQDPALALFLAARLPLATARLAEAAGVAVGIDAPLRVNALAILLLAVAHAWRRDDSADLGATMKELDRRLAQAERVARFLPHRPEPSATPPVRLEHPTATMRRADDPQAV